VEEWKPMFGYEDTYNISSMGKVQRRSSGRILIQVPDGDGYLKIRPCQSSVARTKYIHRLVAKTFLGAAPEGYVVNHVNGVKTDNRLVNLCYVTQKENVQHAIRLGLREAAPTATLSKAQIIQIRRLSQDPKNTPAKIAKRMNLSYRVVRGVVVGKTYKNIKTN